MKKYVRFLILALALSALMCMTAFAEDAELFVEVEANTTFTMDESGEKFTATYTGATSGQYLILMVSNSDGGTNYTVNATNIQYVNQTAATEAGVTFVVYPKDMMDAKIILAGPNGPITLGYYKHPEPDVLLGDANLDGVVDSADTTLIYRYVLGSANLTDEQLAAADVNGDGSVNSADTTMVYRYVLGLIPELGAQ